MPRPDAGAPAGRTRERRDPEATRQALVAAGADLFGESGYDGVSIEDVADLARVNKALISYHFGGKRGLYAEILASGFRELASRLQAAEAAAPDAAAAVRGLLRAFDGFRREHPEFPGLFMREVLSTGIEPRVVPHFVSILGVVRKIAARGEREGVFRRVDPLLLHFGLVGPLVFFAATEKARRRAAATLDLPFAMPEMPEFLEHLERLTLRGLAPAPRRGAPRRGGSSTPSRTARKPKGARA
jgi:TetR/AcrR family transcriptional regulator